MNGTYYINNTETGKYLHKNQALSTPDAASGLISNLGNTIRWKITHLGEEEYVIQPVDDLTKYLKTISPTGTWVTYGTPSATEDIPDEYRWKFRFLRFQNVSSSMYLYVYTNTLGDYSIGVTSNTSKPVEWRIVSTERYGNTSSYEKRELTSSFSISDMALTVGEAEKPAVNKSPTDAIWADPKDFTFEYDSGSASSFSINQATQTISAICYGDTKIKATHKVTGMVKYFDLVIRHENPYTDLLISDFRFTDEAAVLITKLYSAIRTFNDDLSVIDSSWRFARIIGAFNYDESFKGFASIAWDQVAGNPVDVYEGNSRVSIQTYITKYLGFTNSEYNTLKNAVTSQHISSGIDKNYGDFAHMQISIAARLAYYMNKTGLIGTLGGLTNSNISYLAGWLGDATIDETKTGLSFNNDDYIADLDAENIYRTIIAYPEDGILQSTLLYYNVMKAETHGNRAVIFQRHVPYETVLELIYGEFFPIDCTPENCWFFISTDEYYLPVYNFLQSLIHNSANMED